MDGEVIVDTDVPWLYEKISRHSNKVSIIAYINCPIDEKKTELILQKLIAPLPCEWSVFVNMFTSGDNTCEDDIKVNIYY